MQRPVAVVGNVVRWGAHPRGFALSHLCFYEADTPPAALSPSPILFFENPVSRSLLRQAQESRDRETRTTNTSLVCCLSSDPGVGRVGSSPGLCRTLCSQPLCWRLELLAILGVPGLAAASRWPLLSGSCRLLPVCVSGILTPCPLRRTPVLLCSGPPCSRMTSSESLCL